MSIGTWPQRWLGTSSAEHSPASLTAPSLPLYLPQQAWGIFSVQGCARMRSQSIYRTVCLKYSEKTLVGLQHSQDFAQIRSQLSTSYLSRSRLGYFFFFQWLPPTPSTLQGTCLSGFRTSSTEAGCRRAPWINDIYFLPYRSQTEP